MHFIIHFLIAYKAIVLLRILPNKFPYFCKVSVMKRCMDVGRKWMLY